MGIVVFGIYKTSTTTLCILAYHRGQRLVTIKDVVSKRYRSGAALGSWRVLGYSHSLRVASFHRFFFPNLLKEKKRVFTYLLSIVLLRKKLILRRFWVWSCGVTRNWGRSLLLHSKGEESLLFWIWITKNCSSVDALIL